MSDETELTCTVCGNTFTISTAVLDCRVIHSCNACYRTARVPVIQNQIFFVPDHVIDGVYLGGYQCGQKLETLAFLSISRVIVCGAELECPYMDDNISYLKFDLDDDEEQDISQYFDQAHAFMHHYDDVDGENVVKNVLVHCAAGVSRSATIVLSYLMKYHGMAFEDARRYLRSKRRCICPNQGFIKQLQDYEEQLGINPG